MQKPTELGINFVVRLWRLLDFSYLVIDYHPTKFSKVATAAVLRLLLHFPLVLRNHLERSGNREELNFCFGELSGI